MFTELRFIPNSTALRILSDLTTSIEVLARSFVSIIENPDLKVMKTLNNLNTTEKEMLSKAGGNLFFYRKPELKPCVYESIIKVREIFESFQEMIPESQTKYHDCLKVALDDIEKLTAFIASEPSVPATPAKAKAD